MEKRCVRIIFFIVLVSTLLINIGFCQEGLEMQKELDNILLRTEVAQTKILDNKITEARNIMWEEVDPVLKSISDSMENNIETLIYIGVFEFDEINLSQGDIKRATTMFEKTKVDVTYTINEMDFQEKIYKTRDVVKDLKEIGQILPEINVIYTRKKENYNLSKSNIDSFSIYIKDIDTYKAIKDMNITKISDILEFNVDEVSYTYTNKEDTNQSVVIKSINKKIKATQTINQIEIYEVFTDKMNASDLILRTSHMLDISGNKLLLYKGTLTEGKIIPLNFIIKTNMSIEDMSQTIIILPKETLQKNTEETVVSVIKKEEKINFGDIDIKTKQNYVPYIILGILVILFLLLVINSLSSKEKLAKDLETYRKKINNLKGNK
ncbi:MAG: hypothetical protein WC755_07475 [Candidatus Woesearchaeota archaeon]|jgi:hypothetical protein